jgi:hypothetical protein
LRQVIAGFTRFADESADQWPPMLERKFGPLGATRARLQ